MEIFNQSKYSQEAVSTVLGFIIYTLCFVGICDKSIAQNFQLDDLDSFRDSTTMWHTAGEIQINPLEVESFRTKKGKGILVGTASRPNGSSDLYTDADYEDMVLEFEMLLGHGGSADVFLQGRYGVRLADSWNKGKIGPLDTGVIIPPSFNREGVLSMGYIPRMNVSQSPGTWQKVKIEFEVPRFDKEGDKIRDAKIISVEQNGVVIQENKYLSGSSKQAPFSNEVTQGPVVFRVSKGNVAFRNIQLRAFSEKTVKLEDLRYSLYVDKFLDDEFIYWGGGEGETIPLPDLSSREPTKSGRTELLHTTMTRGMGNDFALVFTGKIHIPESGEYIFEAVPNGLGKLELNNKERFRWNMLHNKGSTKGLATLEKGSYNFKLTNINYGQPGIGFFVEGTAIKRQPFHKGGNIPKDNSARPIMLNIGGEPLIQRSFIWHEDQKLLSGINIGSPKGIHYSINLSTGSLIRAWRGEFGEVTSMWRGRGEQQVLEPLGSILPLTADQQVLFSKDSNRQASSELQTGDYKQIGYDLNEEGEPIFQYRVNNIEVQDHIIPGAGKYTLTRSLNFTASSETEQIIWYRLANASNIEQVSETLFSIADKTYYIKVGDGIKPVIEEKGKNQLLLVPVKLYDNTQELIYSLIW